MKRLVLLVVANILVLFSFWQNASAADLAPYVIGKDTVRNNLMTRLELSSKEGQRPLILLLGGSNPWQAFPPGDAIIKRLNDAGYHVLTAEFFLAGPDRRLVAGHPDFPSVLENIRIESFWEEIDGYLRAFPNRLDRETVGVIGISRGGELALLLASYYQQFKFVVASVPSHICYQATKISLFSGPTWLYRGEAVPYASFKLYHWSTWLGAASWLMYSMTGNVNWVNTTPMHYHAVTDPEERERCRIKVEKINGPILFISGGNDQFWPGSAYSEDAMKILRNGGYPFLELSGHYTYPEGDHFVSGLSSAWDETLRKIALFVERR